LIQQILDFSRRAVLERWPMDLVDLLKNQTSMLARMLPENINLTFDYGDDDYSVYADTTRLQQVLANLAVNARDAMPQGGSLHFRLSRLEIGPEHLPAPEMTPGTWIKLTVADTGTGIPDDVLPHIFEPFFTTKDDSGSGLGLAQVYGIVAQHEGHIDVQTRVNEGTAFDIYLPALNVGSDAPTLDEHSALEHLPVGRGEQILVVEDETIVRRALVESLTTLNYRVLEATDGEKALEILQTHSGDIDLIFSDLIMPVMGGAELFQILQQQGGKIPIVLISGHPMDKERGELKSQGVTGWLRKPPTLKNLAKVAAEALSTDGQAREQKE
jgi:CheY-like chemotaxis protein